MESAAYYHNVIKQKGIQLDGLSREAEEIAAKSEANRQAQIWAEQDLNDAYDALEQLGEPVTHDPKYREYETEGALI